MILSLLYTIFIYVQAFLPNNIVHSFIIDITACNGPPRRYDITNSKTRYFKF